MRRFISACMIAGLCAFASPAVAQSTVKQDTKKAGQKTEEAGKATGSAIKSLGKATAKATKRGAKATENGARAAKHTVKGTTVTATCNDGTTYSGKSRKGACSGHKGVKAWT